jgi:nucleotide-binding universal stress UspA family protein
MGSVIHACTCDQEHPMSNQESSGPVVVGIDGSDAAIGAARWAAKEAVHHDVPLRLVYVIQTTDGAVAAGVDHAGEEDYAGSSLRAACLAVEATGLPVMIETAVLRADVDSALIDESDNATLICVGSSGIGRVANIVLGSTAATVAEYARCSVAIIRWTKDGPLSEAGFIAVVVDDKPGSDEVMQSAIDQARVRRAPVLAVGVWGLARFEVGGERFYRRVDHWSRRHPDVQIEVATTHLSLARYLEGRIGGVQLVVISGRDANRVPQLIGPEGLPVFAHANCSVLVVRGEHH